MKKTVKVKLSEQQPEDIKPQAEMKRSAEMSEVPKLEAEMSSEPENNNVKPDEKTPAAEEKGVEQEETQVDETLVSSRLAEVQDRAVENEITERVRGTMPMMPSRMSRAAGNHTERRVKTRKYPMVK